MENSSSKISFKIPLLILLIFVVFVAICVGILSMADKAHKDAVYKRYADEANSYISTNKPELIKFFTEVFPNEATCNSPSQNSQSTPCKNPDSQAIAKLLPSTLKDWSSTVFIKQVSPNKFLVMRLSGDVSQLYSYSPGSEKGVEVEELFSGKRESISWDMYTYQLNTKEVIIPVKDQNNKIVGAIVRGVIEQ